MTKAVADFLSSGLLFSYWAMIAGYLSPPAMIRGYESPMARIALHGVNLLICSIMVPAIINQMIDEGATQFIVDDYKQILVIACKEASQWSTSERTFHVNANLGPASLEEDLQIRGQPIHVLDFCTSPPMSLRELILN
jgi:hypothetical protein